MKSQEIHRSRPTAADYPAFYGTYVSLVPEGDVVATLEAQIQQTLDLWQHLTPEQAAFRYAPDKWTAKQIIGHLADSERVFAYRLLRFGRGDATELAGFDQNPYVEAQRADEQELADLLEELMLIRRATLRLVRGLSADAWQRRGIANGAEVSVAALIYSIAGHVVHHQRIWNERYAPHLSATAGA